MPDLRDNESWLRDLRGSSEQRDLALADLRDVLARILPKALSRWLSNESGNFDAFIGDVTQETLLRVMDRLDTFEGRSQFTTWVYKIAIRIALNELRHRKWREVSLDGLEEGSEPDEMPLERFVSDDPLPEHVTEQNDAVTLVQRILAEELSPRQQAAMIAHGVNGVPLEEVAQRMGTNRNALYKTLHDARIRMKRRLKREGYEPEEILALFGN